MTKGSDRVEIHLVTLGRETSHVEPALRKYRPHYLVFVTNETGDIRERADEFREVLLNDMAYRNHLKGIRMIYLDPFQSDYISRILTYYIKLRQELHHIIKSKFATTVDIEWVANITGGTNSMAAAMTMLALIFGMRVYYVLPPSWHRDKNEEELVLDLPIFADVLQGVTYCRRHRAQAETLGYLSTLDQSCGARSIMKALGKKSAGSISKRLQPLVSRGYVEKKGKRNAEYRITPLGLVVAHVLDVRE